MLTLHKTLTHVEPKLFVGSFVVCAIGSCAYLAKNSGMGELDISGKKVCRVHPRPLLGQLKLLAHFTHRATHCYLATAIPIRLHVAKRQPYANPVRTSAHLLTQVPLVRYADWGISIPLMLYQLCDLGGAAAMLKVPAAVLVLYTARPHTPRPPRARSVCVAALASAPHPRAGERHRVVPAVWALFQGLCSGTARRQAAPGSSHAVTPPPHTAHTLLFHNTKARTPPAPCS